MRSHGRQFEIDEGTPHLPIIVRIRIASLLFYIFAFIRLCVRTSFCRQVNSRVFVLFLYTRSCCRGTRSLAHPTMAPQKRL